MAAFVSGGFVQPHARGRQATGLATLADVWGTLCSLALVDPVDHSAAASGVLPPVDGMDLSLMITGVNLSFSPRQHVPLMPLNANELQLLDEWDFAVLEARAWHQRQQEGQTVSTLGGAGWEFDSQGQLDVPRRPPRSKFCPHIHTNHASTLFQSIFQRFPVSQRMLGTSDLQFFFQDYK